MCTTSTKNNYFMSPDFVWNRPPKNEKIKAVWIPCQTECTESNVGCENHLKILQRFLWCLVERLLYWNNPKRCPANTSGKVLKTISIVTASISQITARYRLVKFGIRGRWPRRKHKIISCEIWHLLKREIGYRLKENREYPFYNEVILFATVLQHVRSGISGPISGNVFTQFICTCNTSCTSILSLSRWSGGAYFPQGQRT